MKIIEALKKHGPFGIALAVIIALVVWIFFLCGLTGCATVERFALPAVVCKIMKDEPTSARYFKGLADAVTVFSTSQNLAPEELMVALMNVPVDGLQPYEAVAIYGILSGTYEQFYDKVDVVKTRAHLAQVASGLQSAVKQCSPPEDASAGNRKPRISKDRLREAVNEMKKAFQ